MTLKEFDLTHKLNLREQQKLLRQPYTIENGVTPEININGKTYLNFSSNDYLGLASHPKVKAAAAAYLNAYSLGSGASHLVSGHFAVHEQLEQELAQLTGYPAALLFSSGYMANLATQSALADKNTYIFQDRLNHASLIDGAILSRAILKRYQHNKVSHLEQLLEKVPSSAHKLIVTDQIFSMDGDEAPLTELGNLAETYNAALMIDDAHGFGWRIKHLPNVDIYMATLGKAIGTYGSFVAGSIELINYLKQYARPYIYTTALPPSIAAATLASLKIIQQEPIHREKLFQNIKQLTSGLQIQGWHLLRSTTPIQPVIIGDAEKAVKLSMELKSQGLWVTAIRPPTVPQGTSRLRITVSAAHNAAHIERLLEALKTTKKKL